MVMLLTGSVVRASLAGLGASGFERGATAPSAAFRDPHPVVARTATQNMTTQTILNIGVMASLP
jgi:hypothetical protein